MFFEWSTGLDVGVEPMNNDHKALIELMNQIHDEAEKNAGKDRIRGTIEKLENLAVEHFAREEVFMESMKYPGIKQHKEIHQKLLQRFAVQKDQFVKGSESKPDPHFYTFLKNWLSAHIQGIDMHYGEFKKATQKTA